MRSLSIVLVLVLIQCHFVLAAASPPVFTSPPTASTNIPLVGQLITFAPVATDSQGLPISYIFDYGDGTVDMLGAHVYTASGIYTVLISASNGDTSATASLSVAIKGFANLWIKKQSVKVGVAGKESWQAQFIYNADRTSTGVFNPFEDVFTATLGNMMTIQVNPMQFRRAQPKFIFKSLPGTSPSISVVINESLETIVLSAKGKFAEAKPAVLHNSVQLRASSFGIDFTADLNGKFTSNSGYRTAAFVASAAKLTAKAPGKDSAKFSLLLGDPDFQFPGATAAKIIRFRVTTSAGIVVIDKDFTALVAFSDGKFRSGRDTTIPRGTFSYDSLKGRMAVALSKGTLTSLNKTEENVRVDVTLGDQTYSTHITLFAPNTGSYNLQMGKGSGPVSATKPATPPTVTSTRPVNGASGIAINQKIIATFSTGMDPSTINGASFRFSKAARL